MSDALESTGTGTALREYVQRLADNGLVLDPRGIYLAGGAIRRAICGHDMKQGDFDVYVTNDWKFEQAQEKHKWGETDAVNKPQIAMTTYTFQIDGLAVQLHYMIGKPALLQLLKTFDFTCCQFACDGKQIRYLPPALEDAKQLRLRYTGTEGEFTASRAFRFMAMGFKADTKSLEQLQKIAIASKFANRKTGKS